MKITVTLTVGVLLTGLTMCGGNRPATFTGPSHRHRSQATLYWPHAAFGARLSENTSLRTICELTAHQPRRVCCYVQSSNGRTAR